MPMVGPLVACRAYLSAALAERNIVLPVGVVPPPGAPQPHALLSRPGGTQRAWLGDYLLRVRVFDTDAVRLERNTDLLHQLMLGASHTRVTTQVGSTWVTGTAAQMTPRDFDGDDNDMFGMQFAVFWTIALHPE